MQQQDEREEGQYRVVRVPPYSQILTQSAVLSLHPQLPGVGREDTRLGLLADVGEMRQPRSGLLADMVAKGVAVEIAHGHLSVPVISSLDRDTHHRIHSAPTATQSVGTTAGGTVRLLGTPDRVDPRRRWLFGRLPLESTGCENRVARCLLLGGLSGALCVAQCADLAGAISLEDELEMHGWFVGLTVSVKCLALTQSDQLINCTAQRGGDTSRELYFINLTSPPRTVLPSLQARVQARGLEMVLGGVR